MAKLTLYHAAPSRSSITRWMLEETGEPYDIHLLSLSKGDNRTPEYLAVNPMGKVPALKHGDTVITEAAAICAYLADEFPRAKLNVPIGTPLRGEEVLVIGDTPRDIECGRAIGAKILAVATGIFSIDQLRTHQPHWARENLAGLDASQFV